MKVSEFDSKYNFEVMGVSYIGNPKNGTVMFVKKKIASMLNNINGHEDCLVFVEEGIEIDDKLRINNALITTAKPDWEYCKVAQVFSNSMHENNVFRKYRMSENLYYLGENVQIGENTQIEPGCFIGHDVVIGNDCIIHSGVRLENCEIGNRVVIRQNAVIGADAFTLVKDTYGNTVSIPSFGKVILKDNVEVGTLAAIYRGELSDTIIERFTKIDGGNFIGHDVKIGENCEITANCILGGFVVIMANTYIGIGSVVKNRIVVEENCFLCMGSVCTQNIRQGTKVFGNPAKRIIAPN
ncbi:hypothetical protein [uncultured Sphaerochaeta sp.]|uniref:hypothetical protein n=1 Tax=uncultured Sphaerochaeta sp. TaxID=886478 RepID=UPI002A0A430D|nr:hypothetical protein [uncultured Sphaerochaeta sp.]